MTGAELDRNAWRRLLDALDAPALGDVAGALADARDLPIGDAYDAVENAVEDGPLVEDPDAGTFGRVFLEDGDTPENTTPGVGSRDETPIPDADENRKTAPDSAGKATDAFDPDFTDPEPEVWPDELLEREQWMLRKGGKAPWAPWADPDAPVACDRDHADGTPDDVTAAECHHSARYKWGSDGSREHVHAGSATALEWREKDPRAGDDLVFIQCDEDPYAFVDGDDVRDPDTGEVHPAFLDILDRLGATYADVSISESGSHTLYRGELPEGVKQAGFSIDSEPWGANDDIPKVEIFDGKHVNVSTGKHVPGTPTEPREWNDDELRALLEEHDELRDPERSTDREDYDLDDYDADATDADETTDDIRDLFAALDRLDARQVAADTIVHTWNDDATTSGDKRAFVPTWGTGSNGTANVVDREIWQDTGDRGGYGGPAVMAAIDSPDLAVDERATPDDIRGAEWFQALDHLRGLGYAIPDLERGTDPEEYERTAEDLKALDVTLDPGVAHDAADAVVPDDLENDLDPDVTPDRTAWRCGRCEAEIGVVRAAAIDAGITPDCSRALGGDAYHRAYEHARREAGAPLPEYVTHDTATERWGLVEGAIRELDYRHLDEGALASTVTGEGDAVDGGADRTLDPAWRDSESGESVVVFPSGVVYDAHPDHEGVIDALRLVALDAGVIGWGEFTAPENALQGETFKEAYRVARQDYGAPLPRWQGTDAYHTVVLPEPDALVEGVDEAGDEERLQAARDAVGDLYRDAAASDDATLLNALPGLGKTYQVAANAGLGGPDGEGFPTFYGAGRKELMKDMVERCREHGASSFVLPVFAENGPPEDTLDAAEAAIREGGQHLLRDRWQLVDAVGGRLKAGVPDPHELEDVDDEEDTVDLDRASCPTADGEHGVDWWLAVHAARARGYRPRQIHENAETLFGAAIPCGCDDDDHAEPCSYTRAWERATDPDDPKDVLIGHYTLAHVYGARTYRVRENGRVKERPRVVALDEFPGEAYHRAFGDEFPDLAAWLAGALRADVDDRTDLFANAAGLWNDDAVRAWFDPEDVADEHDEIVTALGAADAALDAIDTAEYLLDHREGALEDLGLREDLEAVVDAHPEFQAGKIMNLTAAISRAADADENRGGHENVLADVSDLVDDLRAAQGGGDGVTADLETAVDAATHVDGALADLVADAITAYRDRRENAAGTLAAAIDGLEGGRDGCEALAMHADDGHAHPLAYALLYGVIAAEGEDAPRLEIGAWSRTWNVDEPGTINAVEYGKDTVLVDRGHRGAVVSRPPAFTAGGGENAVVGLDATGRAPLWELAIGREVHPRDIHGTPEERRAFLRDVYGLQVVQTDDVAHYYEGGTAGKDLDGVAELVKRIAEEYAPDAGQNPAVVTTNDVERELEDRLAPHTTDLAHYGDLKGSNALAENRLAALLGCQHFGDEFVEKWSALAGEEVTRTGRGMGLDYGSRIGNVALRHMREDQVMQAALRFGRDAGGAVVFAHTGALRDDLPVVAEGRVPTTFSEKRHAVVDAAAELYPRRYTAADVRERLERDGVDVSPRTVRRVLRDRVDAGDLERHETKPGVANAYEGEPGELQDPGDLPDLDSRALEGPGQDSLEVSYTWSVRVHDDEQGGKTAREHPGAVLPAPDGGEPPGEVPSRAD